MQSILNNYGIGSVQSKRLDKIQTRLGSAQQTVKHFDRAKKIKVEKNWINSIAV